MDSSLLARHIRRDLVEALGDSRAVALLGARQVGKSTLVTDLVAAEYPARLINLDDDATANAARADPAGFIADISGPVAARKTRGRARSSRPRSPGRSAS